MTIPNTLANLSGSIQLSLLDENFTYLDGAVATAVAGATGTRGASGVNGATGIQGPTGGASGPQGASGIGATGLIGATGIQGASGSIGVQGASGVGATGVGATGAQGVQGATGVGATGVGATGAQGVQGASGATGTQGASGVGATGAGVQGATGQLTAWSIITGSTGIESGQQIIANTSGGVFNLTLPASPALGNIIVIEDGANWQSNNLTILPNGSLIEGQSGNLILDVAGVLVYLIYDGSQWQVSSTVGAIGATGVQGASGSTGPTGATGIDGASGSTGPTGATGFQGASGIGATGIDGASGIQGVTGGASGPSGASGATGIGNSGSTGAQGASGSTGLSGAASVITQVASGAQYYPVMSVGVAGALTLANITPAKLYFVPSTGVLSATVHQNISDLNQKTNIKNIDGALNIIENLNGVRFNWKDNNMPSVGLIAQDVEKYLPELVDSTTGEFKALNYSGIIGVLVEAVKELSSKIKTLEEENGN
jgi:collagen type VII alpha